MWSVQEEQPLSALLAVSQHLEAGRYREFWQGVDACSEILAAGDPITYLLQGTGQGSPSSRFCQSSDLAVSMATSLLGPLSALAVAYPLLKGPNVPCFYSN